jgi:hypothetical protein
VKGRAAPVKIYELVAEAGRETQEQQKAATAYAEGLFHWRAREFDAAVTCFSRVADVDKPSALFLKRSQEFAKAPPDAGWEPVSALESK